MPDFQFHGPQGKQGPPGGVLFCQDPVIPARGRAFWSLPLLGLRLEGPQPLDKQRRGVSRSC